MLPTTLGNQEQESIFICVYSVGNASNIELLAQSIGINPESCIIQSDLAFADINGSTSVVFMNDLNIDVPLIATCDGVIFALDATTGVSTPAIGIWQELADLEIPRQILATNLFATHTDFDELVAISRRVFSEEILVRFLPMADDEETQVVALYDLLKNQILDYTSGECVTSAPDVEHVELTADQRESLFESLAYLGLSDDALEMYQAGITPPVQTFEQAWANESTIAIAPLDGSVGQDTFRQWISTLVNRWNPTIESDEHLTHTSTPNFYGIGVATGLARTWGQADRQIEITDTSGETEPPVDPCELSACLLASNIQVGDVIHEQGQTLALVIPSFD